MRLYVGTTFLLKNASRTAAHVKFCSRGSVCVWLHYAYIIFRFGSVRTLVFSYYVITVVKAADVSTSHDSFVRWFARLFECRKKEDRILTRRHIEFLDRPHEKLSELFLEKSKRDGKKEKERGGRGGGERKRESSCLRKEPTLSRM